MIRRGDKRGQFYLAAAAVIIVVIVAFAGVNNSINRDEPARIYDLKDELGIESGQVLDHGIYNELDTVDTNDLLEDFAINYSEYVEGEFNLYFVFGNEEELVVSSFTDLVVGEVGVQHGGGEETSKIKIKKRLHNSEVLDTKDKEKITVDIEGNLYDFDLKAGDNFYFLIYQKTQSGTFVERGGT